MLNYLHSTMVRFIMGDEEASREADRIFTFHYG